MKKTGLALLCLLVFFISCDNHVPIDEDTSAGLAKMDQEDFKGALENFNKAAEKNPEDPNVYFNLARAKFLNAQSAEALEDISKALAISEMSFYYLLRAEIQYSLGNFDAAFKDAEASLFLNDNYNENWTYFIMSQIEMARGNLNEALDNINIALQNGEKTASKAGMSLYYWFSAVIKYDLKNKSEALDDINKALMIIETLEQSNKNEDKVSSDQIAKFYSLRANIKKDLNDIQGSVKDIDSAIALLNDFLSKNDKSQYEGLQGQLRDLENQKQSYK